MSFLIYRDYATLILDGATILLMIILMILTAEGRKRDREDDRFFLLLLIVNCCLAIGDIFGYLFDLKQVPGSIVLCKLGMTVFYFCYVLISMIWVHYCRIRFKDRGAASGGIMRPEYIPGAAVLVLILLNVFTGFLFSYDDSGVYRKGTLFIVLYLILAMYIIAGFVHLVRYRSRRSGRAIIPVWVYVLPGLFGSFFGFAVPGSASFAPIGLAMSIAFTHIGTINEILDISYGKATK